jgi:ArsR family transcriptional regulator
VDRRALAEVAKALSSETRVAILETLGEGPLCVNAIASRLGITGGAVSQHLRVLRQSRLVEGERRGYHVHYRASPGALVSLSEALQSLAGREPQCAPLGSAREDDCGGSCHGEGGARVECGPKPMRWGL